MSGLTCVFISASHQKGDVDVTPRKCELTRHRTRRGRDPLIEEGGQEGREGREETLYQNDDDDDDDQDRIRAGTTVAKWEKVNKNCLSLLLVRAKGFMVEFMLNFNEMS